MKTYSFNVTVLLDSRLNLTTTILLSVPAYYLGQAEQLLREAITEPVLKLELL